MATDTAGKGVATDWLHLRVPGRLALIAVLLVLEKLLLGLLMDYESARAAQPDAFALRLNQSRAFHFALVLLAALALFVVARDGARWRERLFPAPDPPFRWPWLAIHGLLFALLLPVAYTLYRDGAQPLPFPVLAGMAVALTLGAACTALAAVMPLAGWRRAAGSVRELWLYSGFAALIGTAATSWSESLWPLAARGTFMGVQALLQPLLPSLHSDPQRLILATDNFAVYVATACSGLEGAGLMLVFCAAWLLCFRSEYRFPRALLLIPAGLVLSLALNVLRIAVLVLIGHSGHPAVAIYGFHSQAGWIAFTAAAMALAYFSRRSRWMNREAGTRPAAAGNPTAAYLLPFLAILAAGMVAHAASSGFEYLYVLRFLACAIALWAYRRTLAALDWRCGWRGVLAGVVVFVVWVLYAHFTLAQAGRPDALARLSPGLAVAWIAVRATAAVLTVPLAEELAYRGFLLRRWQRVDFELQPFPEVRWPALVLTAVIFGISHGAMWPVGIVAGLVYGVLAVRTGRLGECVLAHAITNALLAAMVLVYGQWQYW